MEGSALVQVAGFPVALDRSYHAESHMWVFRTGLAHVRIGMDSLGLETSGTLAQLSFAPVGSELTAGRPFGQLEAAKFVGPLISPVTGTLLAVNDDVVTDASLAERDPYEAGWLIDASLDDPFDELQGLLADPAAVSAWFADKIAEYRLQGVISE